MESGGCVYILNNWNRTTLYTGVTSDLCSRIVEHKNHHYPRSFTARYKCTILVYWKFFPDIEEAIAEEKRIKGYSRKYKESLINAINPRWEELTNYMDE